MTEILAHAGFRGKGRGGIGGDIGGTGIKAQRLMQACAAARAAARVERAPEMASRVKPVMAGSGMARREGVVK